METFRGGKKRQMLDVFGPWTPVDIAPNRDCTLPTPLVVFEDILECNFEWTADGTMPYDIFECLRRDHKIDVTGLSTSLTHRGNLYRSYALLRGEGRARHTNARRGSSPRPAWFACQRMLMAASWHGVLWKINM